MLVDGEVVARAVPALGPVVAQAGAIIGGSPKRLHLRRPVALVAERAVDQEQRRPGSRARRRPWRSR